MANPEAWVTLATNDSYCLGALVLGTSLRRVGTTRDLVVMVTPNVSPSMRSALQSVFNIIQEVNVLDSGDEANLALLSRPELGITFTKLHCWKLVQYTKCVFLDADTLVIQPSDELFEREEFSAAPDVGWPDCFNSGVFVYRPSLETYERLLAFALEQGSFDGGDQGLLNRFFSDWSTADIKKHLPFVYNMVASAVYSYLPAYKVFGQNVKIAHFIGPNKPWLQFLDTVTGTVHPSPDQANIVDLLQAWWDIFKSEVHHKLVPDMKGLAGVFAQMSLEGSKSAEQLEHESIMRKHAWEQGHIDFLGKDSFDNIYKKIQESMAQASAERAKKEKTPEKVKRRSPPKTVATAEVPPPAEPIAVQGAAPAEVPVAPVQVAAAAVEVAAAAAGVASVPAKVAAAPAEVSTAPAEVATAVPADAVSAVPADAVSAVPAEVATPLPQGGDVTDSVAPPAPVAEAVAPSAEPTPPCEAPVTQASALDLELEGRAPVDEPLITPSCCPQPCICHPRKPLESTEPPRELSLDELEDEILAVERAALEKKLTEQKKVAEQKLISERAAAAEAAAKKQEAVAAEAAKSEQAAPPAQPEPVPEMPEAKVEEVKSSPVEAQPTAAAPADVVTTPESKPSEVPATTETPVAAPPPATEPPVAAVAAAETQAAAPPASQVTEPQAKQEPVAAKPETEVAKAEAKPEPVVASSEPSVSEVPVKPEAVAPAPEPSAAVISPQTSVDTASAPEPKPVEAAAPPAKPETPVAEPTVKPEVSAAPPAKPEVPAAAPAKPEAPTKPKAKAKSGVPTAKPEAAAHPAKPEAAAAAPAKPEVAAAAESKASEAPAKPAESQAAASSKPDAPAKKESAAGASKPQEPKAPPRKQAAKAWSLLATAGATIVGVSLGTILYLRR